MIALLCSVPAECALLIEYIGAQNIVRAGSKDLVQGTLSGHSVVLCAGGMGKANAAHAATLLMTRFTPSALIIFGVGGAYPSSGAQVGDLVLAAEEIAGDEGVLAREGFRGTEYIGIPLVKTERTLFHNRFPAPEQLRTNAVRSLSKEGHHAPVRQGPFITLSTCTGTAARAEEIERRYDHPLCENMEGAAAAQVAELHSVPWLEMRSISNIVEDRDLSKWDIPRAAANVQSALRLVVERWGEMREGKKVRS